MAASFGNRVLVNSLEEYERLLALPGALAGHFDPDTSSGEVQFASPAAAVAARGSL